MKKKIILILALIFIIMIVLTQISLNKDKHQNESSTNKSLIAYMYEDGLDTHEYKTGTNEDWTSGEYILNFKESKCKNSNISWDNENNKIILNDATSNECKLYFDVKAYHEKCNDNTLACQIAKKVGSTVGDKEGEELLYHDNTIDINGDGTPEDAGDSSYRYSGDNPDNFVCFGPGAENYTGNGTTCADDNLYRIIGVIPTEMPDGHKEYLVKLIKSEYVTEEQLGIKAITKVNIINSELSRVKQKENISRFHWNEEGQMYWEDSVLGKALNNEDTGFLKYLKGSGDWLSKIETVKWYSDQSNNGKNARFAYQSEIAGTYYKEWPIGLIHLSDYGFATAKINWNLMVSSGYTSDTNIQNNWLYNGVWEWLISRTNSYKYSAYRIRDDGFGCAHTGDNDYMYSAVRPSIYLKSDVRLIDGTGTKEKPYLIS